jgi:hypothetical protein
MPPRDPSDLTVFITSRDATCDECHDDLGRGAWINLGDGGRAFCLACADLDHLVFLPAGDAALTRRARVHSTLSAVVLRWSRARKRYERQGLLVEAAALEQAEGECLSDTDARARRREREAEAVHLAVAAHVRHHETDYDALLSSGLGRHEARDRVAPRVREVLLHWQSG